jgi:hypothetical protein
MTLTVNAKAYTANSFKEHSISYTGPTHTLSIKDEVKLSRVPAKPTVNLSGVSRTTSKLTRTLTLTGALTPTHDAISDHTVSIPVGASSADIDAILNDIGAYIASAAYKTLVKSQLINY